MVTLQFLEILNPRMTIVKNVIKVTQASLGKFSRELMILATPEHL